MRLRVLASAGVIASLLQPASAQTIRWATFAVPHPGFWRLDLASSYDIARSRFVVHGGHSLLSGPWSDTYEWTGTSWQAVGNGPALALAAMSYDPSSATSILFGGSSPTGLVGATWQWNGTAWTQLQPTSSPGSRMGHAMTTDFANNRIVLHGGRNAANVDLADTWIWNGTNWQLLATTGPSPRWLHDIEWDPSSGRIVLFGGSTGLSPNAVNLDDTWELVGSTWVQHSPVVHPPASSRHRLAWSPPLGGILLTGTQDSWQWNGTTWTNTGLGGPGSFGHCMEWNPATGHVVAWGGVASHPNTTTWAFGDLLLPSWAPFGVGCAGPQGPLQSYQNGAPALGRQTTVNLFPVTALGAFVVGWSNQFDGSVPLPASLASFGAPGCDLLVSMDVLAVVAPVGGMIRYPITLPFAPALVGQRFFVQGAVVDPGANPLGLVVSRGITATIGW
jgi:hypothetical protein